MIAKRFSINLVLLVLLHNAKAEMVETRLMPIPPEIEIDYELDQAHKEKYLKEKAQKKFYESLKGKDLTLFEEAFAQAPLKIKTLVSSMLKGESYTTQYKTLLLTGLTGSGKTILAQAIAYKLQRRCIVIHASSLLSHYHGQAAKNLQQNFIEICNQKDKPILIMEDIDALTDASDTTMQLWTLLNKYKNDKSFLFIGTTTIKKMPHLLQSQFKTFFIKYPCLESRKRSIKFHIQKLKAEIDSTCTDIYIQELAQKIENFSQRDIEALLNTALLLYLVKNPNRPVKLTKKYLDQAYIDLKLEDEKLWDFSEQTTQRKTNLQKYRLYHKIKQTKKFNNL